MLEKLKKKAQDLQQAVDEKSLVKEIKDKIDTVDDISYRMQNYLNIAYYAGKQWLSYDKVNKKLIEPPKSPYKTRITANRIQPIVRTELAKITKSKPIMNVIPASDSEEDIASANIGDKVTSYIEYELDCQKSDKECILWGLTTEAGYIKPFWDITKGDKIDDTTKTGDINIDVVSPFEVKYDPSAKKWSEVRWLAFEKARDVYYVKQMYNKDVTPDDTLVSSNIFESQLKNLNSNFATAFKPMKNGVKVTEYWEKPTPKYPKGRRVTFANDVLLLSEEDIGFGENDNTERELPLFPFFHIKVPGRVQGMSIVEQLMPIQKEYNLTRSQIVDHRKYMTNPKWIAESGTLIEDITDEPDQVIEYRPGSAPPHRDQPTDMSQGIYKNLEQCIEEFYFISGQQEVSHGSTPPGVTSGIAISFLEEQDDTKLGPSIANWIDCKQAYMSYLLKMIRFKYDIPRTIKLVGDNNKVEVMQFEGSQLTSTDVRIQEGSMQQNSKTAKLELVSNLVKLGLLNVQNPVEKDFALKLFDLDIGSELQKAEQEQQQQLAEQQAQMPQSPVHQFLNSLPPEEQQKILIMPEQQQMAYVAQLMKQQGSGINNANT